MGLSKSLDCGRKDLGPATVGSAWFVRATKLQVPRGVWHGAAASLIKAPLAADRSLPVCTGTLWPADSC